MGSCGGGIDERTSEDKQATLTRSIEEWGKMSWLSLEMRVLVTCSRFREQSWVKRRITADIMRYGK